MARAAPANDNSESETLQVIIVTAQKRSENLQEVLAFEHNDKVHPEDSDAGPYNLVDVTRYAAGDRCLV